MNKERIDLWSRRAIFSCSIRPCSTVNILVLRKWKPSGTLSASRIAPIGSTSAVSRSKLVHEDDEEQAPQSVQYITDVGAMVWGLWGWDVQPSLLHQPPLSYSPIGPPPRNGTRGTRSSSDLCAVSVVLLSHSHLYPPPGYFPCPILSPRGNQVLLHYKLIMLLIAAVMYDHTAGRLQPKGLAPSRVLPDQSDQSHDKIPGVLPGHTAFFTVLYDSILWSLMVT